MIVVPDREASQAVESQKGGHYVCPLCKASHTGEGHNVEWVEFSTPNGRSATVCLGCCIDIFNTCRRSDFDSHPYLDIVQRAADYFRTPIQDFRRHCLQKQVEIMRQSPEKYSGRRNEAVRAEIERVLSLIHSEPK